MKLNSFRRNLSGDRISCAIVDDGFLTLMVQADTRRSRIHVATQEDRVSRIITTQDRPTNIVGTGIFSHHAMACDDYTWSLLRQLKKYLRVFVTTLVIRKVPVPANGELLDARERVSN